MGLSARRIRFYLLIIGCVLTFSYKAVAGPPDSLEDVIAILQTLAGNNPSGVNSISDINNDNKIGLAEAIYALRRVAEGNVLYGEVHAGQYHLGPVDFAETQWHNACAPAGGYRSELLESTGLGGEYLAGVSNQYNEGGGVCDTCILINTDMGKDIIARVVTYGATNEPGDIDVSPSVYGALNMDEYPRKMTWQFVKCPVYSPIKYEYQTGANIWWTSLWVRNACIPIAKVEVKSDKYTDYIELQRGVDGTLTDSSGFGQGSFTLRVTAIDGQAFEEEFESFTPGNLVESANQFE